MTRRIWTLTAALAALAAIVAVPSALAAYTTPKLEVRQTATATTFRVTQSSSEDATALARIFVPAGTTLTTTQAPGTVLGRASALLKLHGLAGAEVPVEGSVVVAAPGQVPADSQLRCLQGRDAARDLGAGREHCRGHGQRPALPRADVRHACGARAGVCRGVLHVALPDL